MTEFLVRALPAGETDPTTPTALRVVADGPSPCRRCLRDATTGDDLYLLPYNPFTVASPYTGPGPVYVHAGGCEPRRLAPDELPEQVHDGRQFSVRAYDEDAMIVDTAVVPGGRLADTVRDLLRPGVAFLHAHFAGPGCFAFRIDRAG